MDDNQEFSLKTDVEEIDEEDVLEVIEFDGMELDQPMEEDDNDSAEEPEMDEEENMVDYNCLARFTLHSQPVFCISSHPVSSNIIVSGGADDLAHIWDSSDGSEIMRLDGFKDSVSCAEFSNDGSYLACASVDGLIKVWRNVDEDRFARWEFLIDLESTDEVTWLSWHSKGNLLLVGSSDGMVSMWQIPSGKNIQVFAGHTAMVTCGCFTPDGKSIVTGSESSELIQWDPKTGQAVQRVRLDEGRFRFKVTNEEDDSNFGINSLAVNSSSTICAVGGISNGGLRVINLQSGSIIGSLDEHQPDASVSVGIYEPKGIGGGLPVIVSAGTDGLVYLYDASTFKLRSSMNHQDGVTSLVIHKNHPRLTTGSMDKTSITWDLRTGKELQRNVGHHDLVHQVRLNSDETRLVSCSDDGTVCVFKNN
ncbi:WD40-repeat-containing domain protein [Phakopsora pachyrhizi]|uniref:WD40-repeat-containing domain protein n=1 Tax=Phakopsora pachyrhizi TaxID=170000 RepID=A0AAV0BJ78_PHAPC|nr:WD40-repeat-containing domain protein [Phakopsora pachyrhizi]CAH7686201.1 WD40-repeat-containing domain protein [Phakopsora pachyrhizi]